MSADAQILHQLIATCRQVRRLSPDIDVCKAVLKREAQFQEQLQKLTERESVDKPVATAA